MEGLRKGSLIRLLFVAVPVGAIWSTILGVSSGLRALANMNFFVALLLEGNFVQGFIASMVLWVVARRTNITGMKWYKCGFWYGSFLWAAGAAPFALSDLLFYFNVGPSPGSFPEMMVRYFVLDLVLGFLCAASVSIEERSFKRRKNT